MKSLYDLVLPKGYSVIRDADGLELLDPSGERVAAFGEAYSVEAVEDAAWEHEEEAGKGRFTEETGHVLRDGGRDA